MAAEPGGRLDVEPALADVVDGVQAALELVDWGPEREGAEAWAVQAVRERLEAVNGRMAVGILRSLDEHPRRQPEGLGLVGAWRIGQHLSWSWPFGRDEGASLCRASLALLEEADRLAAGADWSRARAEKTLGEIDGPGVWRPHGEKWRGVPMAVRVLCGAAAVRWKADRERRERAKLSRPAVVRMVAADVVLPLTRGALDLLDDKVRSGGKVVGSISVADMKVPQMTGDAAKALINRGLTGFGHVVGHRLVDAVVRRAWAAHEAGEVDARRVVWERGWQGMAEAVMGKQKDTGELRAIVDVGVGLRFEGAGFEAKGLWSYTERRGGPGRPGEVAMVLNDPLLPGFALSMKRADKTGRLSLREGRRLVPLLAYEPPVGAVHDREAGAVWGLSRRFVLYLVDQAEQLARDGGVRLLRGDWEKLAREAGLDTRRVEKVLRSWEVGESELAPELLRRDADLWTLAEPHSAELAFIVANGQRRIEGRANGKAGVAARNRKRARSGKRSGNDEG